MYNNEELLKIMYQILDKDAYLIVSVPNLYIDKFQMKINKKYMHTDNNEKGHVNFHNKKTFNNLFSNAGFDNISINGITSEFIPPTLFYCTK